MTTHHRQHRIESARLKTEKRNATLTVTLSDEQAMAFAQFLKRVCFSDYEQRATSQAEAYTMVYAGEKIRDALGEQGYAPR